MTYIPLYTLAIPTLAAVIALVAYLWERAESAFLRASFNVIDRRYLDELNRACLAEQQLAAIRRQRSDIVRRGNATRAAKRRALQNATTTELKEAARAN